MTLGLFQYAAVYINKETEKQKSFEPVVAGDNSEGFVDVNRQENGVQWQIGP